MPNSMTPEEATENLYRAIIDHAVAHGDTDPGEEMLDDFAIVAHWQKVTHDGTSNYTTHFRTRNVPLHIAVGLFRAGEMLTGEKN